MFGMRSFSVGSLVFVGSLVAAPSAHADDCSLLTATMNKVAGYTSQFKQLDDQHESGAITRVELLRGDGRLYLREAQDWNAILDRINDASAKSVVSSLAKNAQRKSDIDAKAADEVATLGDTSRATVNEFNAATGELNNLKSRFDAVANRCG